MSRSVLLAIVVMLSVALVVTCGFFFLSRRSIAWAEVSDNLLDVARMRADVVDEWVSEAREDTKGLARRPMLSARLALWLSNPDTPVDPVSIESIEAAKKTEKYDEILVYDTAGRYRGSASGTDACCGAVVEQAVKEALSVKHDSLSPPFQSPTDGKLKLAVAAPIPDRTTKDVVGVLIGVFDLANEIYSMLSWPERTKSGEVYLVELMGNSARYLSPLRLTPTPPVFSPIPTDRPTNALRAIEKSKQQAIATDIDYAVLGPDYRGVQVVSVATPVANTNWYVVAEMDESEAFEHWSREAWLIGLLLCAVLSVTAMSGRIIWNFRVGQHYRALATAAAETDRMCRVYNMLSHTNELIIHAVNRDELLQGIANIAVDHGRFLFVWMGIQQADGSVKPIIRAGDDQGYVDAVRATADENNPRGRGPCGIVLRSAKPFISNRFLEAPETAPWHDYARRVGVRATGVFPLIQGGKVFAAFNFYGAEEDFFGTQEVATLNEMMSNISFALDNLQRNEERATALEKVRLTEELVRLQSACLQAAANGVVITDIDGGVVWANQAFTNLTGFTLDEALSKNPRLLVRSGAQPIKFYDDMWQTILAGKVWEGELTNKKKDGSLYEEHLTITPVRDDDGMITHFVAIKQDITQRLQSQKMLEESELRYRTLIRDLDVGVLLQTADDRVLHVNEAAMDILGLTPPFEESLARVRERLTHPNGRPVLTEELPSAIALRTGKRAHVSELGMTHLITGARLWHDVTATPRMNEQGECVSLLLTFVDVTRKFVAERDLAESRDRLDRAMEAGHIGLWDWGKQTRSIKFYDRWPAKLGYPDDQVPRGVREWLGIVHPEDLPYVLRIPQDANELHFSQELRLRHFDGSYHWYLSSVSIERNAQTGQVERMSGANIDIDDRKRLEEEFRQAQRMESVGRLAGGVAHDFNNLLSVISGYTELTLACLPEDSPVRHDLEQVQLASQRAADLTGQLLAFSRRQILRPKVLDLNMHLHNLEKMLRRLVGEDVEITLQLEQGLGKIYVDPGQVDQVFMNLVVNARDAMPYGGKLTITTESTELLARHAAMSENLKPGPYVAVTVADTGIGMDAMTAQQIFEPFFTTKEQGKGTGLGLATVYGIVQQSGGLITVRSTPGKGTEFKILLPIVDGAVSSLGDIQAREMPHGTESILFVEDEPALRELTRRTLLDLGYTVTAAGSGAEALDLYPAGHPPFDLLLTDVVMPGMSGPQLAEALKAIHPELKVLFITGYTDEAIVQHGVLKEGVQLINKPLRAHILAKALRDIFDAPPATTA